MYLREKSRPSLKVALHVNSFQSTPVFK